MASSSSSDSDSFKEAMTFRSSSRSMEPLPSTSKTLHQNVNIRVFSVTASVYYLLEGFFEIIAFVSSLHVFDETQKFSKIDITVTVRIHIVDLLIY